MPESFRSFERFISTAFLWSFISMLCWLLNGCGGGTTVPPVPIHAMNGNFSISAISAGASGVNTFAGAVQTDSAGHVTGIVHVQGSFLFCFGLLLELPLTGTIDSTGRLDATITGSGNQAITLNAIVSPSGALLSDGNYSGSGTSCVGGDHGAITGFQVQPFTGTYSGTFNPSPSTNITLELALTQSAVPDSRGTFPLSASRINLTGGGACGFASATLAAGAAIGDDLELLLLGSDQASIMIFTGTATGGDTRVVRGLILVDTGPCSGQNGLVNLSRQ